MNSLKEHIVNRQVAIVNGGKKEVSKQHLGSHCAILLER